MIRVAAWLAPRSTHVWSGKETRPLAFFAGLWTTWTSVRKLKEGPVTADLFGILTTQPNAEVGAIHPKAMPVILTSEDTTRDPAGTAQAPLGCGWRLLPQAGEMIAEKATQA